jgi:hypothetical protein
MQDIDVETMEGKQFIILRLWEENICQVLPQEVGGVWN